MATVCPAWFPFCHYLGQMSNVPLGCVGFSILDHPVLPSLSRAHLVLLALFCSLFRPCVLALQAWQGRSAAFSLILKIPSGKWIQSIPAQSQRLGSRRSVKCFFVCFFAGLHMLICAVASDPLRRQ